jgi:hypothetical protein
VKLRPMQVRVTATTGTRYSADRDCVPQCGTSRSSLPDTVLSRGITLPMLRQLLDCACPSGAFHCVARWISPEMENIRILHSAKGLPPVQKRQRRQSPEHRRQQIYHDFLRWRVAKVEPLLARAAMYWSSL